MKSIMYHYVQQDHPKLPNFNHLHIADFEKQIHFFESNFGLAKKEDFLNSLKTGIPVPGVVLTFDDGLKCHYSEVFPLLKKLGLWGLFYISTGVYQKRKLLDVHRIHVLLGCSQAKEVLDYLNSILQPDYLIDQKREEFTSKTYQIQKNDEATNLIKRILNYYVSYEYREGIIDQLCQEFVPKELLDIESFYVTGKELSEMEAEGMIIGSHTVNHPVMSKLTYPEQCYEVEESFSCLQGFGLNLENKTFCYPYGGFHSFTPETEEILESNHCHFSFNVESRDISPSDLADRKQALPRYDCNEFPFGQVRRLISN